MRRHLNTLYITTQGAYLGKDRANIVVSVDGRETGRVPIHTVGGIVCFGRVGVSPFLMGQCGEEGVALSFLNEHGRYLARVVGPASGNVLLRREQYRRADDAAACAGLVRSIVIGKTLNQRTVIARTLRDHRATLPAAATDALETAAGRLADIARRAEKPQSADTLRGLEGEAARTYFGVFNHLVRGDSDDFVFSGRSRRPPLDPVNALLSFVYALLVQDARAAAEAAGLDPAVGFLHRDRPGRPSLALDLMEEFRPFFADRLALSLINRGQVTPRGFTRMDNGACRMDDATRKTVLVAYQDRKRDELTHPFLEEKVTVGLLWHIQAQLLARHLRGDLDAYPPFVWR